MSEPQTFEQAVEKVFLLARQKYKRDGHRYWNVITAEAKRLMVDKQKDYGHKNIMRFAELGIVVRASDKVERLQNLLKNGRLPRNESIRDTFLDLVNYAIIGIMVMADIFDLPLEEDVANVSGSTLEESETSDIPESVQEDIVPKE